MSDPIIESVVTGEFEITHKWRGANGAVEIMEGDKVLYVAGMLVNRWVEKLRPEDFGEEATVTRTFRLIPFGLFVPRIVGSTTVTFNTAEMTHKAAARKIIALLEAADDARAVMEIVTDSFCGECWRPLAEGERCYCGSQYDI